MKVNTSLFGVCIRHYDNKEHIYKEEELEEGLDPQWN